MATKPAKLFRMLNPINRIEFARRACSDTKSSPTSSRATFMRSLPHVGRGGWTWYTGSAGWLYRAGLEWILGFRLRGMMLTIDPCIPRNWPGYSIKFRYHSSTYKIRVENPSGVSRGVASICLDGLTLADRANIPLIDDGKAHRILVLLQ